MTSSYIEQIEQSIFSAIASAQLPPALAEPVTYALTSGGKRLRPLITVLAAQASGASVESAIPVATAIEILHNFTLVHDDIMDRSPLRRGKQTVYTRWDEATAILAGDTMMGIAYNILSSAYTAPVCQSIVQEFSSAFVEVCIGQAEDLAFRTKPDVTMEEYLGMISRKTARLFATAAVCGGIVAHASAAVLDAFRQFGTSLGIAFQVQDDMLDLFGEPEFGKQRGQDLREGKKTFPVLAAFAAVGKEFNGVLRQYLDGQPFTDEVQIEQMAQLCTQCGVIEKARTLTDQHLDRAIAALTDALPPSPAREELIAIANRTRNRRL